MKGVEIMASTINVQRLVGWGMLTDTADGTTYEAEAHLFPEQLNLVRYTPRQVSAKQYGDGIEVNNYVAKDGGDLDITICSYEPGDNEFLFGESATTDGTTISTSDDVVPEICIAYAVQTKKNKQLLLNLYKFPKVTCIPSGEEAKQREGSNISFGTASIKASYAPLISSHAEKYERKGVDPVKDAEFIEKWFTQADFYTDDTETG